MKTVTNFVQEEKQPFNSSVRAFMPPFVVVPLTQTSGKQFYCKVKENDTVTEGQIIAIPDANGLGNDSASIHSPIPGKVTELTTCSLPDGKIGSAVRIRLTGSFSYLGRKQTPVSWKSYTPDDICTIFAQKGVVNTFLDSFALSTQIRNRSTRNDLILCVRLFDEDPSRDTDSFVAAQYKEFVLEGTAIIAKALNAKGVLFAQSKYDADEYAVSWSKKSDVPYMTVNVDTKKYPAGFKQNIIQGVKHDLRNQKDSAFATIDVDSLFIDTETALSAYEAVVYGIPVVERYVHVTGDCLRSAGMFKVRIGTTIASLAEQCGGFKIPPAKIIINGMIIGSAVSSLDTPITKQVKSILFVPANQLSDQHFATCIRCGKCRRICPEGLYPDLMYRHQTGGKPIGIDLVKTAALCSGCCLCNSVCPSRLPLSQTIALQRGMQHE